MAESSNKKWYKHGWGLAFAILLFPIFIIWYAWAESSWGQNEKIALTVLMGIFLLIVSFTSSDDVSETPTPSTNTTEQSQQVDNSEPESVASFEGKILNYEAINPATLRFAAQVENVGDAPGKFDCTVRAHDESRTYSGFDFFEDEEDTPPGETKNWAGTLTITNEGAAFVTEATIDCD